MNFHHQNLHHQSETYFRQGANPYLRQQVYRQNVLADKKIWPRIWNVLLTLSSILLLVNLWLSQIIANLDQALQVSENVRHELTEDQISLRAIRDELYSPDSILMLASEKISLQVPEREQVRTFN